MTDLYVFGCSICHLQINAGGAKNTDVDQILLPGDSCFSVHSLSRGALPGKNSSVQSELPTLACWSPEKREERCEANQLFILTDFGTSAINCPLIKIRPHLSSACTLEIYSKGFPLSYIANTRK